MQSTIFDKNGLLWIDIQNPNKKELDELSAKYKLPKAVVKDVMDPSHLPKRENFENSDFVLLRHFDLKSMKNPEADTIRELTRKVAIFSTSNVLITVHRTDQPFLERLRQKWAAADFSALATASPLLDIKIEIIREVVLSFDLPLQKADDEFEVLESKVFSNQLTPGFIEDLYFLKQQVRVYRRMLRQNMDVVQGLQAAGHSASAVQDLREEVQRVFQLAEELVEDIQHLFNTHISLASHRTNETMRLLTVFSIFFMPLTFIVGVYGMNFRFMPELESRWGYPAIWALMIGISVGIFFWVKRKGWLRSDVSLKKKVLPPSPEK